MFGKIISYFGLVFMAAISAANYAVFVFPNKFAPAGIDGMCTLIQDIININIGYLSLIINIPLLIFAFILLDRDFALKNAIYIIVFSIVSIILSSSDISKFRYITESGTSIILAPIATGVIRGLLYYFTLKLNGASGGADIIAGLVKSKKPYLNFMHIIFSINTAVAVSSYFVYGMSIEPVICSILYSFVTTMITNSLRSTENENIKYEIITPRPEKLCSELSGKFHQSATIINAHGSFSGTDTKMVVCVVNKKHAPYIEDAILNIEDCVVFKSYVGNFLSGTGYI